MRIRFSDGTANIQDMIKELQCLEKYLADISSVKERDYYIKSADLYIRICNEDDEQIEFTDTDDNIKVVEFRAKPYKTAKM